MIIDELFEAPQQCPECGGISFSDLILAEKKDACYYKVKASAKVWPSAYASGRLVQCRKKGAANYGNKSEGVAEGSGQKPTITYKDYTLQYDYQTEDDDPEGYSTATTYYFDVFKDGNRVGEAEYFDYFGDLTIRINGKTKKFEHQHPLASQVSQLVSSLPDEQKRDLSDPKFESQGVAEGLNEMDKSAPQPGRDGKVSHSTYGSRDKKGSDYFKGKEAPGKAITAKQASKDALDILKKQGVAEGSNQSGLEQLIQQYEDMVENVYGMVPGPRQRKEIAARDALEARIEALPGGKSALEKWARAYNDSFDEGVAEEQELDEKWSQKYKSSINCANPKGFSQRAHCAGRKKNEDVEESLGKQIHSTFQTMGDSFSDAHLAKGISYFLQGRHQEGENWLRGKIPSDAQAAVFGKLKTLQAQGGVDVNKNPRVQQYIDDKLVPWVKNQIQQNVKEGVMYGAENLDVGDDVVISGDVNLKGATGVIDSFGQDKRFVVVNLYNHGKHSFHSSDVSANDYDNDEHDDLDETRRGQVPMTLKPGETDNLEPEDIPGFRKLPAYKQGYQAQQQAGQQLIQKSPYTFQSDQDWAYRQGAFDAQQAATSARFANLSPLTTEGEQQKGADYRDPKEVDYDDEYDAMVARVKKLAGLGPMKTVYDPTKRQYRNMPTAVQPKK